MSEMRELTKDEKKLFDIFIKGYCEGIKAVPINIKTMYVQNKGLRNLNACPSSDEILLAFKDKITFIKRNSKNFHQFKTGYTSGYFQSLASEKHFTLLDPELNEDIYDYLKSVWLHEQVYGGDVNAGSK